MQVLTLLVMLSVSTLHADDIFSPSINILDELKKVKSFEQRMDLMEKELEKQKAENTALVTELQILNGSVKNRTIKIEELTKLNEEQSKETEALQSKMNEMKTRMDELIKQSEATKVAFSASLLNSYESKSTSHTLSYKYVFINNGEAYNPSTGTFTAPMRGIYQFLVFSKAYGSKEKGVVAGLFMNGQHKFSTYARQNEGFIGSSNGISLLLQKGDTVYVNVYPNSWIFDNAHHHSTFSGHLLFPM